MALQFHSPSSLFDQPYHHLPQPRFLISPAKLNFSIRSENPSTEAEPANDPAPAKKSSAAAAVTPGIGFGSPSPPASSGASSKKKTKGKRERAAIIRRSPVEKPEFIGVRVDEAKAKEQGKNESAFVLTWLGLGGVILVQGILLSASGFLPEEWDRLFVKYLYPTFTPTVGLFVAGTVAYGVLKYLQNENLKDDK
ncbi:unnamed protein product [Linum trigynum]|uniref:Protein LOW PSII ACCUMULATION 2, chloroplastic n=1 Tax=Linum trigynum TaxID=586398 RepID=A0AAV2G5W4_9ROSI